MFAGSRLMGDVERRARAAGMTTEQIIDAWNKAAKDPISDEMLAISSLGAQMGRAVASNLDRRIVNIIRRTT